MLSAQHHAEPRIVPAGRIPILWQRHPIKAHLLHHARQADMHAVQAEVVRADFHVEGVRKRSLRAQHRPQRRNGRGHGCGKKLFPKHDLHLLKPRRLQRIARFHHRPILHKPRRLRLGQGHTSADLGQIPRRHPVPFGPHFPIG